MDKTTVCNEAVAAETSGDTRDEVNNKSGMGFEARKCDWGDVRDDALSSDRHRGYTCAGVSECGAYSLILSFGAISHYFQMVIVNDPVGTIQR